MALPFKNGFELAQAMGFGKMYQASKEQNENNIQMESKNMNRQLIRLTESDLHNIVKEAVNKILNEMSPEMYLNYQKGRLNQANQAKANGDYDTEMKMRSKAAVGGNAWGDAMRQRHGFDSIDDFNQTAQKSRNGITNQSGNPKHQNYINYQNDAAKQFN